MARPGVAVVIPVIDEAATIGDVVRAMPRSHVDEVIVVDGGSRDGTPRLATEAGARVVAPAERGYGRACQAGAEAASPDIGIVVWLDGDGSDDPAFIPALVAPLLEGRADFVISTRTGPEREPGSLTVLQLLSGHLIGRALGVLAGVRYSDMSPFRAIRRDTLAGLGMREMTYGWNLEMQMRAGRAGLRVIEIPVRHRRRAGGESKVSGSLRGTVKAGYRILATLLRVALERDAPPVAGQAPTGR